MIITIDFIKSRFNYFNDFMFEGKLAPLPIKLTSARTFLGQLKCHRKLRLFGGYEYFDFQLLFSSKFELDQEKIEDTILHEMIHYYILSNQIKDTSSHGKLFRAKMREINTRFNRNITIRHKFSEKERDSDIQLRYHYICISKFIDGRFGITIAAHSRLFYLWDLLECSSKIIESTWYISRNPYFNRFPRSITGKIYKISEEELSNNLNGAKKLRRVGNKVYSI